jgi:uncharacterized protein (DUF433 family)
MIQRQARERERSFRSAWPKRCLHHHREHNDDLWSRSVDEECDSLDRDFEQPFSAVLKRALENFPSVSIDVNVLGGTPRISGTRIPVYMVIDALRHCGTVQGVLSSYPDLTIEQVEEALCFAGAVLEHPVEQSS